MFLVALANCRGSQCMIGDARRNNKSLQHVNERLLSLDISTQIPSLKNIMVVPCLGMEEKAVSI